MQLFREQMSEICMAWPSFLATMKQGKVQLWRLQILQESQNESCVEFPLTCLRHILEMSWCWPDVVTFHQHLSFVATSIFGESLYIEHTRWWLGEKILTLFFFIAFLNSLFLGVHHTQKRKNHAQKSLFYPKVWPFLSFFWHFWTYCALDLMLLNFEKSGLQTFPTKFRPTVLA